ncbi:MAG TPA: acetyltransferase [Anaerolineae bacterium]|nr:acetyltransferase [Anaerolineae bacterium]HQK12339.1 acetyltransferase [Anaerolineae bacterium]
MTIRVPVHVLGGGGHAKVVISTLLAAGFEIAAVYDDAAAKWGQMCLGFRICGPFSTLPTAAPIAAVAAVGDNRTRQAIVEQFKNIQWVTVIHPRAWVHSSVIIGGGTVVFAGAVIQPETYIGEHCIINTGATVDHECRIGDYVHVAPGVHLAGNVNVHNGALLGIGSVVLPGVDVGDWTTVGAGGVVIHDLPGHSKAIGVPAKVK